MIFLEVALGALSVLDLVTTDSIFLWKLTIGVTEYGNWLGALALLLMLIQVLAAARDFQLTTVVRVFFLLAISVIFFRPVYQARVLAQDIDARLERAFGALPANTQIRLAPFDFGRLWRLTGNLEAEPEKKVFSRIEGQELGLDFYRAHADKPAPLVLIVHGGGWDSGDATQMMDFNRAIADSGYSVAAITYRLAPRWHWPAPHEDVVAAVTYLKEHANELGLDPTRWVIMGRSAGAQIAQQVAYSLHDPTLKGLVSFYGPADLVFAYEFGAEDDILGSRGLLRQYMGGGLAEVPSRYRDASGIEFVRADSPPTLIFHGERDILVWTKQSARLAKKLQDAGVAHELVWLPWGTHAFDFRRDGPGGQLSEHAVRYFLANRLYK